MFINQLWLSRRFYQFVFCLAFFGVQLPLHAEEFPHRPLKIVVYTNPGGLVDVSARKLAQVLEQQYVKTPVVVENLNHFPLTHVGEENVRKKKIP